MVFKVLGAVDVIKTCLEGVNIISKRVDSDRIPST